MLRVLENSTGSMRCYMQFGRTRFGAALLHRQRANGPAIYLAQSEGLGVHANDHLGLKARPLDQLAKMRQPVNGQAFGPFFYLSNLSPALQAGLGKLSGLCPLKNESATSN